MKRIFPASTRTDLRIALRAPLGAWKRFREPQLAQKTRYPLAICAIFREEAPFLDEWLTFHAGIGATHFYLYNNFSTDHFREVLQPWIRAGWVTLTEWPVPVGQLAAYRDCLRRFQHEARWIAFMDVDEFLFSPQAVNILPLLETFAHLPGIEVWQIFFGASGHDQRPLAPVTESYTMCAPARATTVKTIANPRMIYKVGVHQSKYWHGIGRDTAGRPASQSVKPVFDLLRMNHYWSRSLEDLRTKVQRGDASTPVERDWEKHLKIESELNRVTDHAIQPIARAIRSPAAGAR